MLFESENDLRVFCYIQVSNTGMQTSIDRYIF